MPQHERATYITRTPSGGPICRQNGLPMSGPLSPTTRIPSTAASSRRIADRFFTPDPALGFPPGAPAGMAATMSTHAVVHTIAFFVAFISLVAAMFVFVHRFLALGHRGWAAYCAITGLLPFPLIALSEAAGGPGVDPFLMAVITSAWVVALPARLSECGTRWWGVSPPDSAPFPGRSGATRCYGWDCRLQSRPQSPGLPRLFAP